jgi:phenylacetate-coenzyme A ligase PaaK-like adenylate-forming protein
MARILAEEQLSGRLHISPKAVMTASEVLTDESRLRIRSAWNCEPFNVYAATETAGIASECSRHRLHMFQDLVIAEIVDDANRPVPPGEFGAKLLVTVLFSRSQPLIRYEISDRVMSSSEPCGCGIGFATLQSIEGRAEDILEIPARSGRTVRIHPNVFHQVLESEPLQAWQIVQEEDGIRVLLAQTGSSLDTARISLEIERALEQQGAVPTRVHTEQVKEVTRTAFGKAPLIRARSNLPPVSEG